ncbi:hypothetical protein J3E68DRAFT_413076 [Trichoderma sp. SZMC 28012]
MPLLLVYLGIYYLFTPYSCKKCRTGAACLFVCLIKNASHGAAKRKRGERKRETESIKQAGTWLYQGHLTCTKNTKLSGSSQL